MRIDELDEFQGLTLDMVHAWLTKYKWVAQETRGSVAILRWWAAPREDKFGVWIPCELAGTMTQYAGMALAVLADEFGMSVQDFLREINPRMRKGIPSQEALRAHRGLWLRSLGKENIATVLSRQLEEFPSPRDAESCFWPCDENYNKTRWPTDAQGNML